MIALKGHLSPPGGVLALSGPRRSRATPAAVQSLRPCPESKSTLSERLFFESRGANLVLRDGIYQSYRRGILGPRAAFASLARPRRGSGHACGGPSAAALPGTPIYPFGRGTVRFMKGPLGAPGGVRVSCPSSTCSGQACGGQSAAALPGTPIQASIIRAMAGTCCR